MIGFPTSVLARLAAGLAFMAGTWAMVWAIERPPNAGLPTPAVGPTAGDANARIALRLSVESSYRVTAWTVQILGVDQPPARSDHVSWTGNVHLAPEDEVLIQAKAEPDAHGRDALPHHILRIRLGSYSDRIVWSSGDVTATVGLPP